MFFLKIKIQVENVKYWYNNTKSMKVDLHTAALWGTIRSLPSFHFVDLTTAPKAIQS